MAWREKVNRLANGTHEQAQLKRRLQNVAGGANSPLSRKRRELEARLAVVFESREEAMSATGLPVFDKTLQTTNIWLDEIMAAIGPDRQLAWKALSVVLHTLRDRLSADLAAHLGAELPLLVRGTYYDQYKPSRQPTTFDLDDFVEEVAQWLADARPTDPRDAMAAVFAALSRHVPPGQILKIQQTLPANLRDFWRRAEETAPSVKHRRGSRQRDARLHS